MTNEQLEKAQNLRITINELLYQKKELIEKRNQIQSDGIKIKYDWDCRSFVIPFEFVKPWFDQELTHISEKIFNLEEDFKLL